MKSSHRTLAACAALVALSACATTPAPADAELYTNFTLIDPATETRIEGAYMLVSDGRILAAGRGNGLSNIPPERRRNMNGGYALPGLIDTHAHVTLGRIDARLENGVPVLVATSEDEITTHNARMLVAHGVTTIRSPGGNTAANARYAANIRDGVWLGPTALSAGTLLDTTRFDGLSVVVSSYRRRKHRKGSRRPSCRRHGLRQTLSRPER